MEKYISKIQPKYYGLVAAVLSAVGTYIILSVCQYAIGGKYVALYADSFNQYVPYIRMFIRNILEGESVWYSWSSSMGMNTSMLNLYYVMSPFNLLYLILWGVDENVVTVIIIVLKSGLSAYTFQMFAKRVLKCDGLESIFFALTYSLSMYAVLYGHMFNSWTEGVYMLPLICVLIYELSDLKSYLKLIFAYAYIFVTQFYFAYMVGIFTFVFWIVLFFFKKNVSLKSIAKDTVKYVVSVFMAAGSVAVALLPAVLFLINCYAGSGVVEERFSTQIYHLYYSLFWGNRIIMQNNYPALYCGWIILIFIPLYFLNKNLAKKEKIASAAVVVWLGATMLIEPLYIFMHAFDEPNALNFRHAFLLVFVLCAIACRQSKKLQNMQWKKILIVAGVQILLYVVLERFVSQDTENTGLRLLGNIVFGLLWVGIIYLHQNKRIQKYELAMLTIGLLMVEVCVNGWYGIAYPYIGLRKEYECWKQGMTDIMAALEEDNDFYRAYYELDLCDNSDAWFGYNGIRDFSSVHNSSINNALANMGLMSDTLKIFSYGITPPVETILGVKYRLEGPIPAYAYDNNNSCVIELNPYYLQPAYMVDSAIKEYEFSGYSDFDNINTLLQSMCDKEIMCFTPYAGEVLGELYQANITNVDDDVLIFYDSSQYDSGMIVYYIPEDEVEKPVYAEVISNTVSVAAKSSPYLLGGIENVISQRGLLSAPYIKPLILEEGKWKLVILMNHTTADKWLYKDIVFYEYHEEALQEVYDVLSTEQIQISEYGNGYVKGTIDVSGQRDVLFTTIPYDEAWEVTVDGKIVNTFSVLDSAFLALELEPGFHELEFVYHVPGLKTGVIVSVICIGCYVALAAYDILSRKKKALEN